MVTTVSPALKWIIIIQTVVLVLLLMAFIYVSFFRPGSISQITSYEECTAAKGSRIQESYPATCVTKDNQRFTQPL